MLNFKKEHLSTAELAKITTLTDGKFDVGVMTELLTKIGASLAYYEPDAMVKSYLYQHSRSLVWDRDKLNFRNPKDKDSRNKGDPKILKGSPIMIQRAPNKSVRSATSLRLILKISVGALLVDKREPT